MAYGGGTWLVQNKVLPGSYINFVSLARAIVSLADRGYAAMPLELDWGVDGEVFTVENSDFQKDSLKIFGYSYDHEKMKGLRDLFSNAKTLYAYKLNEGAKASNEFATAKYAGKRGNDIKISISANVDDPSKWDVDTMLDNKRIDSQTVSAVTDLKNNDFVDFKSGASLSSTSATPLTGGTNGTAVAGAEYQKFLDKIETYYFNTLGCLSTDTTIKKLFIQFTKRMRNEVGAKFQTVLYRAEFADFEGVISVQNKALGNDQDSSAVYWVTGAEAGCEVNKSVTNKTYEGDFKLEFAENQTGLANGIKAGKFLFHRAENQVKVLTDINTFTSIEPEKNDDFSSNQTIRVLDQIAVDIARLFNKSFVGKVANDAQGRTSLWDNIVDHHKELQKIRAIENFDSKDVAVEKGKNKKSVIVTDKVTPVNAMEQLYMTVIVA
jgi:hypothetical protein